MRKKGILICIAVLLFMTAFYVTSIEGKADEKLVIVIDPGHGGENLGGQYEQYVEKELNPIVAQAMKEELEKYEGVEVYLTRETDIDMSIKDRAKFAKEKNADFLFCLHFNMSVKHDLFGAEVWVPATGEYYSKGYAFAEIQMQEFADLGLYSRGIKTRLNDRDQNYYGILRYCTEEGIPSALIEHCHLDHAADQPFYQEGEEQLRELGRMDATAVAKYFGLKSDTLGVDYRDYPVSNISIPSGIVRPDETAPELCSIEVESVDQETGEAIVRIEAKDAESYIQYYSYSTNGGNSYSDLQTWPRPEAWNRSQDENRVTIQLPFDRDIELRVSAYNGFDKWTESNIVSISPITDPQRLADELEKAREEAIQKKQQSYKEIVYEETTQPKPPSIIPVIIIIIILILCIVIISIIMLRRIMHLLKRNKRR